MFSCQECGKGFKTARAAARAVNVGCPKCGGVDIDLAPVRKCPCGWRTVNRTCPYCGRKVEAVEQMLDEQMSTFK